MLKVLTIECSFFNSFSSFDSYKKQLDSSLEFKRGNCQNRNTFWFDGICFIQIRAEKKTL